MLEITEEKVVYDRSFQSFGRQKPVLCLAFLNVGQHLQVS